MEKLEKFILSIKYLPAILYFGSVGLIVYDFYCDISNETEFLNEYLKTPLIIIFCYMTYLGIKKYKSKKGIWRKKKSNKINIKSVPTDNLIESVKGLFK